MARVNPMEVKSALRKAGGAGTPQPCRALCDQARDGRIADSVCQLNVTGGRPPELIELVPAGDNIVARDGRVFSNAEPDAVINSFIQNNLDIVIDWEHSTEIKAPEGDEAPAAGWITSLQNINGAIWGRVEWNERGASSVASREYRFISPAFIHDEDGVVIQIVSAGLTNRPALELTELARNKGDEPMDKELLKLLGLAEDATQEDVTKAVAALCAAQKESEAELANLKKSGEEAQAQLAVASQERDSLKTSMTSLEQKLKEKDNATPDADKYVPKSEYDAALNRVQKLEEDSKARDAQIFGEKVEAAVTGAIKAGKLTPESKDFYVQSCVDQSALDRFNDHVSKAPVIIKNPQIGPKPPGGGGEATLSSVDLAVCRQTGISEEEMLAARKEEFAKEQVRREAGGY